MGPCGACHPVITLKTLWGSPGTELSTWYIGSFCCIRAIQRTCIASRPLRSYTAINKALYTIQLLYTSLYTTLYNLCNTPLWGRKTLKQLPKIRETLRGFRVPPLGALNFPNSETRRMEILRAPCEPRGQVWSHHTWHRPPRD